MPLVIWIVFSVNFVRFGDLTCGGMFGCCWVIRMSLVLGIVLFRWLYRIGGFWYFGWFLGCLGLGLTFGVFLDGFWIFGCFVSFGRELVV